MTDQHILSTHNTSYHTTHQLNPSYQPTQFNHSTHIPSTHSYTTALQELASSYTLKITTGGKGDKKRYWGQFDISVTGGGDAEGGDKRIKVEIKGESQSAMDVDIPEGDE